MVNAIVPNSINIMSKKRCIPRPPNYLHKNTVEQEAKVKTQNEKKNNNSQEKKENLRKLVILCKLIIRDTGINRPFLQNNQEKN